MTSLSRAQSWIFQLAAASRRPTAPCSAVPVRRVAAQLGFGKLLFPPRAGRQPARGAMRRLPKAEGDDDQHAVVARRNPAPLPLRPPTLSATPGHQAPGRSLCRRNRDRQRAARRRPRSRCAPTRSKRSCCPCSGGRRSGGSAMAGAAVFGHRSGHPSVAGPRAPVIRASDHAA